jgi:hypothetical protein
MLICSRKGVKLLTIKVGASCALVQTTQKLEASKCVSTINYLRKLIGKKKNYYTGKKKNNTLLVFLALPFTYDVGRC